MLIWTWWTALEHAVEGTITWALGPYFDAIAKFEHERVVRMLERGELYPREHD